MQHIIFVNHDESVVIAEYSPTQYTVTSYVGAVAAVAYDCTTMAEAEQWAKAVIAYPAAA